MEKIKQECRNSWSGETGEQRAVSTEKFINSFLPVYAKVLGLSEDQILDAIEENRDYSAINYYQEANFPNLEGVKVFETLGDFRASIPSKKFRCPSCGGISSDPYECNAGGCDWKSYGFFRTMGKGLTLVIKDIFLRKPVVHEIFMPLEFESGDKNEK